MSSAQEVSIPDLRGELKGEVVGPEDSGYEEARQVFFKGIDRRPAAVVRAANADDVAAVVNAAREAGPRAGRAQRRPQPRPATGPARAAS